MATEAITPIHCPGCQAVYDPQAIETVGMAFCPQCRFPLSLIAGKYRLERLLNQGGFGMLYLARHVGLELFNERVIKVLKPELFTDPDVLRRFRREVQLTANLSEQNNHIVRIYDDFGEAPELGHYYIMEYLRGLTLDAMQEHRQPMEYGLVFHIFYQLCKAMSASHRAGVIHRDLKPDNIFLIQRDGDPHFVKVIDFGLARPAEGNTQIGSFATQQQVMGTPAYMSPEQCQGEDIDNRCDIYSMGILLYQMLTGYHPYPIPPQDTMALFFAHISGEPTALEQYLPSAPDGLGAVILKAMAKSPTDRYPHADAFWQALAPFVEGGAKYTSLSSSAGRFRKPGQAAAGASSSSSGAAEADEQSLDPMAFQATAAVLPAVAADALDELAQATPEAATRWTTPSSSHSTEALRQASEPGPHDLPHSGSHQPAPGQRSETAALYAHTPNAGRDAFTSEDAFAPTSVLPAHPDEFPEGSTLPHASPATSDLSAELLRGMGQGSPFGNQGPQAGIDDALDDDDDGDATFIAGMPSPTAAAAETEADTDTADPAPDPLAHMGFDETLDDVSARAALARLKEAQATSAASSDLDSSGLSLNKDSRPSAFDETLDIDDLHEQLGQGKHKDLASILAAADAATAADAADPAAKTLRHEDPDTSNKSDAATIATTDGNKDATAASLASVPHEPDIAIPDDAESFEELDEDEDSGDTAISTFVPPKPPPEALLAAAEEASPSTPSQPPARGIYLDEDDEDDEDSGDTAISRAPAFGGLTPAPASIAIAQAAPVASAQEMKAIPLDALEALPERHSTGSWRGAAGEAAPVARPAPPQAASRGAPPEPLRWGVWLGVGLAVMAIVAVGVWLLARV